MKDQNEYLNETEVSQLTKRALSTLRNDRFYRRGIPYIKVGKSVRYSKEDVVNFMEARKIQTDSIQVIGARQQNKSAREKTK